MDRRGYRSAPRSLTGWNHWRLAVAAAAGATPSLARADAVSPPALRVDYQTTIGCSTRGEFLGRLTARIPNLRLAEPGERALDLVVRVTRGSHRAEAHGALSVRYEDGGVARRAVDGDTCDSVVDALALMSALVIDPGGAVEGVRPPPPAAGPPPLPAPLPADERSERTQIAVGAAGTAVFGTAPVVTPDGALFVEIERVTGRLFSPSLRAGFDYADSGVAGVPGGDMRVVRFLGSLDACPLAWHAGPISVVPCAHAEGGALEAYGLGITPSRTATRPWFAAGLLAKVRYRPFSLFFVEVLGGVLAPFERDTFYFEPNREIFRAPALSGLAGGALGFTIP